MTTGYIPDDIMMAAIVASKLMSEEMDDHEDWNIIARALMAERDAATKAERERLCGPTERNGIYRHVKTGGVYSTVLFCRIEQTNTDAISYVSHSDGTVWVRPMDEFFDGRFIKLDPDAAIRKGDGE